MEIIEFRAMGCKMLAAIDGEAEKVRPLLEQVPEWFERWEQALSRFRADSELSRLNSEGYLAGASPTLVQVMTASLDAARQSGGLVNPGMLAAVEAAGYDRTFDILDPDAAPALSPTPFLSFSFVPPRPDDWQKIEIQGRAVRLGDGTHVDLGGIAKGWAADRAVRRLSKLGPALVDAGGDIATSGPLADGSRWPVGIADPLNPENQLDLLALAGEGVATSGRDYRRWQKGGVWQHHIIDPRTGQPSSTDVLSATVIGPDTSQAEVGAKVAFLLGSRDGLEWIERRPDFACLLVLENGTQVRSSRLEKYLWG